MDLDPMQLMAQSLVSAGMFGIYKTYQKAKRNKKIVGICLTTGKTNLCKISDKEHIFIDLDNYLKINKKEQYEQFKEDDIGFLLNMFPDADKYLAHIFKSFSNKRLYVVSSSYDLLEQLQIKKIYSYIPSKDLIASVQPPNPKLELKGYILSERSRKVYVFNQWSELKQRIREKFKIKQLLNV